MNTDATTGMPEVASNQFWRVTDDGFGWLHVELRRKKLFGSELLNSESIWSHNWDNHWTQLSFEEIEAHIRNAAEKVIRERARRQAEAETTGQFTGDYPPKRLG